MLVTGQLSKRAGWTDHVCVRRLGRSLSRVFCALWARALVGTYTHLRSWGLLPFIHTRHRFWAGCFVFAQLSSCSQIIVALWTLIFWLHRKQTCSTFFTRRLLRDQTLFWRVLRTYPLAVPCSQNVLVSIILVLEFCFKIFSRFSSYCMVTFFQYVFFSLSTTNIFPSARHRQEVTGSSFS